MSCYRRSQIPGATYFFTINTFRRQPLLTSYEVVESLRRIFGAVSKEHPFVVDAMVVLPDHFHLLMTLPPGDRNYSKRLSILKRRISQANRHLITEAGSPSRRKRRELHFWQRRFWEHQVRDDRDFEQHADYIHYNPVKHGLVEEVKDWPYSTFHRFVQKGIYPSDWGGCTNLRNGNFGEAL